MNRRSAWALLGAALAVMLVLLVVVRVYFPGGLLLYTVSLYALAIVLLLNIRRISRRKQAS